MAANETVRFYNSVSVPEIKAHFNDTLKTFVSKDENGNPKKHKNGATVRFFSIGHLPQFDAEGKPMFDENGLPITKPFMGAVSAEVDALLDKDEKPAAEALQIANVSQLQSDGTWSKLVPTLCCLRQAEADNEW